MKKLNREEVTEAVQKALKGFMGQTVDTQLTARVRDALEKVLAPITARRQAERDQFMEWESDSTEEDVAAGRLRLKVRLLPGAPDHVREAFEKMRGAP